MELNNNKKIEEEKSVNYAESQNKNIDKEIGKYEDTEGLTIKKLNFGLWYIEHRENFKKINFYFWLVLSIAIWTYIIVNLILYWVVGIREDKMLVQEIIQTGINHEYVLSKKAQDIIPERQFAISVGDDKFDFALGVSNPNQDFYGTFDYYLVHAGEKIETEQGFLLPGESKYLLFLSKKIDYPTNTNIEIGRINWSRINKHKISDWEDYKNSHLNIFSDNVSFVNSMEAIGPTPDLNKLEFDIDNRTPFNYWNLKLNILLFRGEEIVALNSTNINEFLSGEKRHVKISWPGRFGQVDRIEIVPDIDILKKDIYIKFSGG